MYTDMDMDKGRGRDRDRDRDRNNVYALECEKDFIQIKKTSTNCGSKEPECCFY
jgi:hypothetical protein